jgi:four helix bundle protein
MFRYEGLDIWKRAMGLTGQLMAVAVELEERRKFKFADQLRDSTLSITNKIAEGSEPLCALCSTLAF